MSGTPAPGEAPPRVVREDARPPGSVTPTFTWEIYRHFYPEPRWPRHPTRARRTHLTLLLLISGVLLLLVASLFTWAGVAGDVGGYTAQVHGEVTGDGGPLGGVEVDLSGSTSAPTGTVVTNQSGYFTFTGVAEGSHVLRFTALGFAPTALTIFLSPYLEAPSGNTTDLSVTMVPGNSTAFRAMNYSPFSNMEDYLSSLFSASVIYAVGGLVAIWGALGLARTDPPPRAVVGGAGAFLAPFFPLALGINSLYFLFYPPSLILLIAAGILGFVATVLVVLSYRPFLPDDL